MKYFKQNFSSNSDVWMVFGCYEDSNITPNGDFKTIVYSINCEGGKYYYEYLKSYFEPDDITVITEEEYRHVVEQLQKVDEFQSQIDEVLKALI